MSAAIRREGKNNKPLRTQLPQHRIKRYAATNLAFSLFHFVSNLLNYVCSDQAGV